LATETCPAAPRRQNRCVLHFERRGKAPGKIKFLLAVKIDSKFVIIYNVNNIITVHYAVKDF
jgi:hypothetical protein